MKQAERKAWSYFRKLLGDDEKYFALKTKEDPIEINGSEGGKYFLYPSGQLARLDKKAPYLGKLMPSSQMPLADYFSALYVWITQREKEFREKWGCGAVSIYYNKGKLTTAHGDRIADLREVGVDGTIVYGDATMAILGTGMAMTGESPYVVAGNVFYDVASGTPLGVAVEGSQEDGGISVMVHGICRVAETEGGENADGES